MGEASHFFSFGEFTLFLDNKRRQLNYVQGMLESGKWRGTKKMSNLWMTELNNNENSTIIILAAKKIYFYSFINKK